MSNRYRGNQHPWSSEKTLKKELWAWVTAVSKELCSILIWIVLLGAIAGMFFVIFRDVFFEILDFIRSK